MANNSREIEISLAGDKLLDFGTIKIETDKSYKFRKSIEVLPFRIEAYDGHGNVLDRFTYEKHDSERIKSCNGNDNCRVFIGYQDAHYEDKCYRCETSWDTIFVIRDGRV